MHVLQYLKQRSSGRKQAFGAIQLKKYDILGTGFEKTTGVWNANCLPDSVQYW